MGVTDYVFSVIYKQRTYVISQYLEEVDTGDGEVAWETTRGRDEDWTLV